MKTIKQLWFLSIVICIGYGFWMYDQLPQEIIIGWRADGSPKDWSDKCTFFVWLTLFGSILNILFYFLSGPFLRKIPESMLNLPWKKYWFATTEKKEMAYRKLQHMLANTGILMNSIALLILNSIYHANTERSTLRIPERAIVWIILAAILIFTGYMLHIMKPPSNEI